MNISIKLYPGFAIPEFFGFEVFNVAGTELGMLYLAHVSKRWVGLTRRKRVVITYQGTFYSRPRGVVLLWITSQFH